MHIARTNQLQPLSAAHPRHEAQQGREPALQHAGAHAPGLKCTLTLLALILRERGGGASEPRLAREL